MAYSEEKKRRAVAYKCMQDLCHTIDRVSRRDRGFKPGFKGVLIAIKNKSNNRLQ